MSETQDTKAILDPHGKPARAALDTRCPRCRTNCPEGDTTKRQRSGGFGRSVHDVCSTCGYEFEELSV